jgi:hypothetical protein
MAKQEGLDRRSGYYQTIAKVFIDLRGAPFFLSSKELDMVRQWEERGIPLRVVLEGIRESFERPGHRGKRRKPYTLDSCNSFVLRAFELYQDRCVGRKNTKSSGEEKKWRRRILREVERFLADIPEELHTLRPVYSKLQTKLSRGAVTEEELEKAEEAIERLIEKSLSAAQIQTITAEIRVEFGKIRGAKFDEIFRIKALKAKREKHKIPHVSPFYY